MAKPKNFIKKFFQSSTPNKIDENDNQVCEKSYNDKKKRVKELDVEVEERRKKYSTTTKRNSMAPFSMMFYAIQYKDINLLQKLIETNPDIDINELNEDGIAVIHFAAMVGSTNCIATLKNHWSRYRHRRCTRKCRLTLRYSYEKL